jgi:Domain of unknown function (DUF4835)
MKLNLKKISSFLLLFISIITINAQELNCNVQINSSQVQGSDKSIFEAMQKNIFEFMNTRKWTNNVFKNEERIECTILINILEQVSNNQFKASIQVQSRRPIYNTSYNSTILNHIDKEFDFVFNEFDNLEYSETTFISNLTSVLSYYAYIILALDYDSYSMKGGTVYLQKAQTIVVNAQSAQQTGWKAFESNKNRYWLVENFLRPNYSAMRDFSYIYHRKGFDEMAGNVEKGRLKVLESIRLLESVHKTNPNSYQMQILFNAKTDELISLFQDGLPKEKTEANNILSKINSINSSKYSKIVKGK